MVKKHKNKILIIEDAEADYNYIKDLIESFLYVDIYYAKTWNAGFEMAQATDLDCILLDLRFDDSSEKAQGKNILFANPNKSVPIIVVSAWVKEEIVNQINDLTPLFRVQKPLTLFPQGPIEVTNLDVFTDALVQAINGALVVSKMAAENEERMAENEQRIIGLEKEVNNLSRLIQENIRSSGSLLGLPSNRVHFLKNYVSKLLPLMFGGALIGSALSAELGTIVGALFGATIGIVGGKNANRQGI